MIYRFTPGIVIIPARAWKSYNTSLEFILIIVQETHSVHCHAFLLGCLRMLCYLTVAFPDMRILFYSLSHFSYFEKKYNSSIVYKNRILTIVIIDPDMLFITILFCYNIYVYYLYWSLDHFKCFRLYIIHYFICILLLKDKMGCAIIDFNQINPELNDECVFNICKSFNRN